MECYDKNSSSGGQTDGNGGETKMYMWNKLSILIKKKKRMARKLTNAASQHSVSLDSIICFLMF